MWGETEIRDWARANHGLVDRRTALLLGATDHSIQREMSRARWVEVHPGVYYLNVTPLTWETQVKAAVLAGGDQALASHLTAGRLWGLEGVRSRAVEITVPYIGRPEPAGVITHRTRRPLPGAEVKAIPLTSVERTMLDLSARLPDRVLEKAMMSALRNGLTTGDALAALATLQGGRGVRGTRRFRRVLLAVDEGITGSVAEVDTARLLRDAPIPFPAIQYRIRLRDGRNAYPDFAWVDQMKIVEIDGYETHSSPDQQDSDLVRQNMLMEAGWQIRRFSARRVRDDPVGVLDEIIRFVNGSSSS